jgi:hypothetical protein
MDSDELERRYQHAIQELIAIKACLNRVSVFEGMVDYSPTALLVSGLVHDHEELESRIYAVLALLTPEMLEMSHPCPIDEIIRLLKGGSRVPDTPEGL